MERVSASDAAQIAEVRDAVTRYATAWLAGDRGAIAACYHDEFTLHYAGQNPLAGTHRGKAAAQTALAEVARRANRRLLGVDDVMAIAASMPRSSPAARSPSVTPSRPSRRN